MRASIVVLLVVALSFAGCASKDKDPSEDATGTGTASGTSTATGSGSKSSTGTSTSSGTGSPDGNRAPSAKLGASTAGGALPLEVNFTLEGSDADGDALTWTLAFADGTANATGSVLPANVTHGFAAAGTYNVTLNVTDGSASALSVVVVNVTAGGSTAGQVANMAWDVGTPHQAGQASGDPYLNCQDGPNKTFNYDSFTMDLATLGQPFKASISAASGDASIQSWRVFFNLEDCSDFAGDPFVGTGAADISGVIPDDASAYVFVMASGGALLEVTFQSGSQITA